MSKPSETASRGLLAAAKRAQSLALDVRSALIPFEGEPWAATLVLQCRRLASDCEERAVDLGRAPREEDRPLIAAIEARACEPIREPVIPATHPSPANGSGPSPDLRGINPGPVAGESSRSSAWSPAFACNRCNYSRPPHAGHPCPECKCPEFRLVKIAPGELTDYERKLAIVEDPGEAHQGPAPSGPLTFEVVEKKDQEAPGHVQFEAAGWPNALARLAESWPGMEIRIVPEGRRLKDQKGSDGRPRTLPETLATPAPEIDGVALRPDDPRYYQLGGRPPSADAAGTGDVARWLDEFRPLLVGDLAARDARLRELTTRLGEDRGRIVATYREYAQLGDAALSPKQRERQESRPAGGPSILHEELARFYGWIVEANAKMTALRSLADELAEDELAAELKAEKRGRGRPPVDPDAGPVAWRVWDDGRGVELDPVTSASEGGARKKARRAHPGLRHLRVEPMAAAGA